MSVVDAASTLGISLQAVHKRLKKQGFEYKQTGRRAFFTYETAKTLFGFEFVGRVISFQIVKGGTGKSTLCSSVAVRANLYGANVLCIDLDQQANLTQALHFDVGDHPTVLDIVQESCPARDAVCEVLPGLDLIPSSMKNALLDNTIMLKRLSVDRVYRSFVSEFRKDYDLILIDCPPAIGQSVAAASLASDVVVAPVTPENFSLSGLQLTAAELVQLGRSYESEIKLKILINKYDTRTSLSNEMLGSLSRHETYGPMLMNSYVRNTQEFQNSQAKNISVFDSLKNTTAREDIDILTCELLGIKQGEDERRIDLGSLEATGTFEG